MGGVVCEVSHEEPIANTVEEPAFHPSLELIETIKIFSYHYL